MASAKTIESNAISTPKPPAAARIALDTLRSVNDAIVPELRSSAGDAVALDDIAEAQGATLIAKGGYNSAWLVKLRGIFEVRPSSVIATTTSVSIVTDKGRYAGHAGCRGGKRLPRRPCLLL